MPKMTEAEDAVQESQARPEEVIEDVLSRFAALPVSEHREWAEELVRGISLLYGAALERIVEALLEMEGGAAVLEGLATEEQVSGVLLLHGLHPLSIQERVDVALEQLRVESRASDIRILDVNPEEGRIHLRVLGAQERWAAVESTIRKVFDRYVPEIGEFHFERPIASTPIGLSKSRRARLPRNEPIEPIAEESGLATFSSAGAGD